MADEKEQHSSKTPNVSHIHTPGVAHEESDVEVSSVAWFTAGLAVLIVLTGVLMWGMFRFFARTEEKKEPPPTSLTQEKKPESGNPEENFPEPRLQKLPLQDLQRYRDEEKKKLREYSWVDPTAGIVRIPVEEAKKKLIKQGLPYRQTTVSAEAVGQPELKTNNGSKSSTKASSHEGKH